MTTKPRRKPGPGRPRAEKTLRRSPLQIQISDEDLETLRKIAEARDESVSAVGRKIVKKFLQGSREL